MMEIGFYKAKLEEQGLCQINNLFEKADVDLAREMIHDLACQHKLLTSEGWIRSDGRFKLDKAFRQALKELSASKTFPNFVELGGLRFAEDVSEDPLSVLPPGQQILFTLPSHAPWVIPHDVWHVDMPRLGPLGPTGYQLFLCLDDIIPKGGGTLIVTGSQRLLNDDRTLRSRQIKQELKKENYFESLFDSKREPMTSLAETSGTVEDTELQIVELSGSAGTAYLMDLRTFHTPASNATDKARIMLTCRFPRTAILSSILN